MTAVNSTAPGAPEADAIAISRAQLVADTCALIRGAGENPSDTDTEAATVAALYRMLMRIGADVRLQEVYPGRQNLRAWLGPADGPAVLFMGHSDVVPAGPGWSTPPFDPVEENGWIRGRGAADMKGGLACVVAALQAVHRAAPELRLELLVTIDEEDRSTGVVAALDGWEPQDYRGCIVAEPTDLDIVVGCRGAANMLVYFEGVSAHAGRPEDGASAITAAALAVDLINRKHAAARAGAADPLFGTASWNVGTVFGGSTASMVAPSCRLAIDRRTLPGEDPNLILEELLADIRAEIASSGMHGAEQITVSGVLDMAMPGFRTGEDAAVVGAASRALESVGVSRRVTGWTAACEGGWIARHHGAPTTSLPTIILGPGDINAQAHQPDEGVQISQLEAAARAYALTVLGLAG